MPLEILYLDPHLVAVNKPAGLLVHRSALDSRVQRFALQMVRNQIGCRELLLAAVEMGLKPPHSKLRGMFCLTAVLRSPVRIISIRFRSLTPRQAAGNALAIWFRHPETGVAVRLTADVSRPFRALLNRFDWGDAV